MILQALTQYYEDLLALGEIDRPGWVKAKVSWALELNGDGTPLGLFPLTKEATRGKKTVLVPQERSVPQPVKRSSGVAANFLCDTCSYLLGVDDKGKPDRTAKCYEASATLHRELLAGSQSPAARAILAFFDSWAPAKAKDHPALQQDWDELMKGGSLLFWYGGAPVTDDPDVQACWDRSRSQAPSDALEGLCMVTGQHAPLARLHPNIKGVAGAQSSGASLVSFNSDAFCSFGHERGLNAPTSEYAAFAYATALNHLLADREHTKKIPHAASVHGPGDSSKRPGPNRRLGDTTMVFWAAGGQESYQELVAESFDGELPSMEELSAMMAQMEAADPQPDRGHTATARSFLDAFHHLAAAKPVSWNGVTLDPNTRFYILGLAPNAARLSVRFFWQDNFGTLAANIAKHYDQLDIVRPAYDKNSLLSPRRLLDETVNHYARDPKPSPRLAGDLLLAILTGCHYPATLLNGVTMRIRAEREITPGRAAIIKAWYLRNSQDEQLKEVMTVELNEQSTYLPYVLGRLFAVLEGLQQSANPGINTTVKDRYFNSASSTPGMVFPILIDLSQKHLAKLDHGLAVYYDRQITELNSRIAELPPARLTLAEKHAFQIGYYHETQKRYTKKEEQ